MTPGRGKPGRRWTFTPGARESHEGWADRSCRGHRCHETGPVARGRRARWPRGRGRPGRLRVGGRQRRRDRSRRARRRREPGSSRPGSASPSGDPEAEIDPGPADPGATPWASRGTPRSAPSAPRRSPRRAARASTRSPRPPMAAPWPPSGHAETGRWSATCSRPTTARPSPPWSPPAPTGAAASRSVRSGSARARSGRGRLADRGPLRGRRQAAVAGRRARLRLPGRAPGAGGVRGERRRLGRRVVVGRLHRDRGAARRPATDPADVDPLTVSVVGAAAERSGCPGRTLSAASSAGARTARPGCAGRRPPASARCAGGGAGAPRRRAAPG